MGKILAAVRMRMQTLREQGLVAKTVFKAYLACLVYLPGQQK